MDADDLDLHFYPLAALSESEREEWHRIVLSEIHDARGCLTLVFVRDASAWVLEGFLWSSSRGGFSDLPRVPYRPLRSRVVTALTLAGKTVRVP